MKKSFIIATLLISGCMSAHTDASPSTPDTVCASLVADIGAIASSHVELAVFPDYAASRESGMKISFSRNLRPVTTKRRIRPSDFEKHGILIQFVLDDGTNPMQATSDTVTYFPSLKLTLYSDLILWEKASPELTKKLKEIMARHKAMLTELEKKTANK